MAARPQVDRPFYQAGYAKSLAVIYLELVGRPDLSLESAGFAHQPLLHGIIGPETSGNYLEPELIAGILRIP